MVKIISDSTCDLSKELLEKYDIAIIPLHIHLGDKEYEDGINLSANDIYEWSDANKQTPKTSVASITEVMEVFQKYVDEELVCFSISEEMSSSANVMRLAAEELEMEERVTVINSQNLSTGIGLLIIEAAVMAENGKSASEIKAYIEELIPKVRASFVVDTLTYLYRGGRCSGVAALAGGALHLHPKIVVKNGKMEVSKKYRGKINKVILSYVKDMEEDMRNARKERVFITHSGCEQAVIDEVHTMLEEMQIFDEILVTRAGGVVSCHCGPGTLGVLFIGK